MTNSKKPDTFPGYIEWLRSAHTGREYPHFVFSADTDMPILGMVALSSLDGPEIMLAMLSEKERRVAFESAGEACEARVNSSLNRRDLRFVRMGRVERETIGRRATFEEFRKNYKKPKYIYIDIMEPGGEAVPVRDESTEDFIKNGGRIAWL